MAIVEWLPTSGGGWPGPTTTGEMGSLYVNLAVMKYDQTMRMRMQQFESKAAQRAAEQKNLTGYELRFQRMGKAVLQQRSRGAFLGDDLTGGRASAETSWLTFVMRGEHWEYPEYFDLRDQLALDTMISTLVSGNYQRNIISAMNRKADSIFFTALNATVNLGDGGGTQTFAQGGGVEVSQLMKQDGTDAAITTRAHHRKLIALLTTLQGNDAFEGPSVNFLAIHPTQMSQLFVESNTPLTSADYNALRPLMAGEVTNYLGMNWIMSTEIPAIADLDATTGNQAGHAIFAWNRSAMINGYGGQQVYTAFTPMRGPSSLSYHGAFFGAVRVDSLGVTYVECADSMSVPAI